MTKQFNMVVLPVVFILSFIFTGLYRRYALRKSILDHPNDRSSHTVSTPRGGGIALAIAWITGLFIFFLNGKIEAKLFYALASGIFLAILGFSDDILDLSPRIRILVQIGCGLLGLYFLGGLNSLYTGAGEKVISILLNFLSFFAILWAINLFNFLDGIDGYISTEVIFIGTSAWLLTGDITGLLLASATLGFLIWNWEKAKIFMGDSGSTLLGFSVAILAIYHHNNHLSSIPVWLILTSVFWVDATVTLFRRMRNREKLSVAHRKHAYQRIVQSGFSHQKTVLWSLLLNLIGLGLAFLAVVFISWQWIFLLTDVILLLIVLKWIDKAKPFEKAGN